jgi:hypothetical protein
VRTLTRCRWIARALFELVLFEMVAAFGFKHVLRALAHVPPESTTTAAIEHDLCDAIQMATCLYYKPVLCLQRAFCTTRLLRARGIRARLVIGYRPVPFLSHAWVEVDGRVVNDSPVYQQRLSVLHIA